MRYGARVLASNSCRDSGRLDGDDGGSTHDRPPDIDEHIRATGCYGTPVPTTGTRALTDVTLLYFDACPSWRLADERLRDLAAEFDLTITRQKVETPDAAARWGFRGSPTILVDGRDVFATGDEPVGLSCRLYQTPNGPAGAPTVDQLRAALRDTPATEHGAPDG
jgi:hypothetical protein